MKLFEAIVLIVGYALFLVAVFYVSSKMAEREEGERDKEGGMKAIDSARYDAHFCGIDGCSYTVPCNNPFHKQEKKP